MKSKKKKNSYHPYTNLKTSKIFLYRNIFLEFPVVIDKDYTFICLGSMWKGIEKDCYCLSHVCSSLYYKNVYLIIETSKQVWHYIIKNIEIYKDVTTCIFSK